MDSYPQFKKHYMLMDNSPVHEKTVSSTNWLRAEGKNMFKFHRIPLCLILLNSSGQLRKEKLDIASLRTENLKTRVAEACDQAPRNYLHSIAKHSARVFEDCLNELPI